MTKYWIGVASADHVKLGVAGGFCQLCHGKAAPLNRMKQGDWIIYYSSKVTMGLPELCQKFTAIGQIIDDKAYVTDNGFYRRNVDFKQAESVSILPLINEFSFIRNKKHWGYSFRYGHLEIPETDFKLVADKMFVKQLP
jgi:hypothetical protein